MRIIREREVAKGGQCSEVGRKEGEWLGSSSMRELFGKLKGYFFITKEFTDDFNHLLYKEDVFNCPVTTDLR